MDNFHPNNQDAVDCLFISSQQLEHLNDYEKQVHDDVEEIRAYIKAFVDKYKPIIKEIKTRIVYNQIKIEVVYDEEKVIEHALNGHDFSENFCDKAEIPNKVAVPNWLYDETPQDPPMQLVFHDNPFYTSESVPTRFYSIDGKYCLVFHAHNDKDKDYPYIYVLQSIKNNQ
jgi:hypothetical protein